MTICCIEEFKDQYEKLIKKKSYSGICSEIIQYFFDKNPEDLCSGSRLNGHNEVPYIKKRLNGSGGYRVYFLLVFKSDCVYLMYIHPKAGSMGYENISDEYKAQLYNRVYNCIEKGEYYVLSLDPDKSEIFFSHVKETVRTS